MYFNFLSQGLPSSPWLLFFSLKLPVNTRAEFTGRQRSKARGVRMPKARKQTLSGTKGVFPFTCGAAFDLVLFVENKPPKTQRLEVHRWQGSGVIKKLLTPPSPSAGNLSCSFSCVSRPGLQSPELSIASYFHVCYALSSVLNTTLVGSTN